MGKEIERKFKININKIDLSKLKKYVIQQGYLSNANKIVTRVRTRIEMRGEIGINSEAFITIKGPNDGVERPEFEYNIPVTDGNEMILMCKENVILKYRYLFIAEDGHIWEIDIFNGDNLGLIIAEIELKTADEVFVKPDWVLEEVSDDSKYYNSNLVANPFKDWR
jgi:adenylate cyclase